MLSHTGHLYSMGSNQFGQLGLDLPFVEGGVVVQKPLPSLLDCLKDIAIGDVVSGNDHCLAVTEDGRRLYAWGQGKFGALGTTKSQNAKRPQQISLPKSVHIEQIAAGSRHSAYVTKQTRHLYMFGLAL